MKRNVRDIPAQAEINQLRHKLMRWFKRKGRDYPWRQTSDPFRVLIAEMMLRRTRADQVKNVYEEFLRKYPDPNSLVGANRKQIRELLYPLGLRWRTPAFQILAKELKEKYECKVPQTRDELKKLSGVGEYVAGAVLSIAYGKREWIVDTNVVRLLSRYFGTKTSKEGRRDKHIIEIARGFASGRNPGKANLAMLDFSALVCTARSPACEKCPLRKSCYWVREQ